MHLKNMIIMNVLKHRKNAKIEVFIYLTICAMIYALLILNLIIMKIIYVHANIIFFIKTILNLMKKESLIKW